MAAIVYAGKIKKSKKEIHLIEFTPSGCESIAVGNLTPLHTPHVNETESGFHPTGSLSADLILIKFTVLLGFQHMVN